MLIVQSFGQVRLDILQPPGEVNIVAKLPQGGKGDIQEVQVVLFRLPGTSFDDIAAIDTADLLIWETSPYRSSFGNDLVAA